VAEPDPQGAASYGEARAATRCGYDPAIEKTDIKSDILYYILYDKIQQN
jgi:hypothetical protein